ncbi:hypothetical protein M404DRAFT_995652 [Pisolithus tinctorius Marx 270]|uniref:Uncharacterized protein n=1 Tax=Pisolithus tinctorius Marx 270 TaxID=870435 RepID=A0A0C3PA46_PISTI|nr:hypothetical protein M404DRAFT_995652 [Pisolithus tinctorius Marx 270]
MSPVLTHFCSSPSIRRNQISYNINISAKLASHIVNSSDATATVLIVHNDEKETSCLETEMRASRHKPQRQDS